jgi:hypothetical protein
MDTKHTPGPWSIQGQWQLKTDTGEWVDAECVEAPKWGIIGAWVDASCDEAAANARLVAAAPELLEACKSMLSSGGLIGDRPDVLSAVQKLRRAVAKAEGRD